MGSVGGGVWKTTNAGRTWFPIFDSQPVASIGAIAVAPSAPDIGLRRDRRSRHAVADLVRQRHVQVDGCGQDVDAHRPRSTRVKSAKSSSIRAIRTSSSWRRSDTSTARIPIAACIARRTAARRGRKCCSRATTSARSISRSSRANAQVIYASLWNTRRPPWSVYPPSCGPGSGLYKSTDGGTNWQQLTNGLPTEGLGRIGIAVAPTSPRRVYAIVDAKAGGLIRSDDAGATWTKASGDSRIWGRGW